MDAAVFIALVSALAAVGSLVAYVFYIRRSGESAAREEALALAETRGHMVDELRAQVRSLQKQQLLMLAASERRIRELSEVAERAEAEAREQAYQLQAFYAALLANLVTGLQDDLEQSPPDVETALRRIRAQPPISNRRRNVG